MPVGAVLMVVGREHASQKPYPLESVSINFKKNLLYDICSRDEVEHQISVGLFHGHSYGQCVCSIVGFFFLSATFYRFY